MKRKTFLPLLITLLPALLSAQPTFNMPHGLCRSPFMLKITPSQRGTEIRYTTDCSEPTAQSTLYKSTQYVRSSLILRAAEFKDGQRVSDIATASYIYPADVLKQGNSPAGYPTDWGKFKDIGGTAPADYEMDPEMTGDKTLAAKISNGFYTLPVLSIVTDKGNLFNKTKDEHTGGIYIYTGTSDSNGRGWERPASVELFGGPEEHDLSVTCALKLHGGMGRVPEKNPKHSFRLSFKSEYGPGKLYYPVFGEENVSEFNSLIVRTFYNYSWTHSDASQRSQAQYARDLWARRMQKRMGYNTSDGIYVHVFLNGMYWGLYNLAERIDQTYCKEHSGGKKEDYDIIKREDYLEAQEGSLDKWKQLISLSANASNDKTYQMILGREPIKAGQEPEVLLDVDNLIDYMLINQYGGNADWDQHNWIAYRNREKKNRGFRFICWDTEQIFQSGSKNVLGTTNSGCPTEIFNNMMKNRTFLHRYWDRAYKHLSGDGVMTRGQVVELWDSLYDRIKDAVYCESARWGDYRRDVHPYSSKGELYTVDKTYLAERTRLLNSYFSVRNGNFVGQLKAVGWYPKTDAPTFLVDGEPCTSDTLTWDQTLQLSSPNYTLFTLDGSDPVSWVVSATGTLNPTTQIYDGENLMDHLRGQQGWVTIRTICKHNSTGWSATVDHAFYIVDGTGIASIPDPNTQYPNPKSLIHDLSGKRLMEAPRRGIYLRDGKKYMSR